MCLIVFAWRPGHAQPLVMAANRDEFYARPAQPLAAWPQTPDIIAGRDLQAQGTWLGVTTSGRFAALTNIREPAPAPGKHSRGDLPAGFLHGNQSPRAYMESIAARIGDYAGFNLLVGNREELWYLNSRLAQPQPLPAGLYGISNAALDTPWPKLQRAKAALLDALEQPDLERLLGLLADAQPAVDAELPETGVSLALERLLSSAFIASPAYGTRASTALIVQADGTRQMIERSFGPNGQALGEVSLTLNPSPNSD